MISIIIATRFSEVQLAYCLSALVPGSVSGLVKEVIVVDDNSTDGTETVAKEAGCKFLTCNGSRGRRLKRGAEHATGTEWLLFLRPESLLGIGWEQELDATIVQAEKKSSSAEHPYLFRLMAKGSGNPQVQSDVCSIVRSRAFGLPYSSQGLLLQKSIYLAVNGHGDFDEHENLQVLRRLRPRRPVYFKTGVHIQQSDTTGRKRENCLSNCLFTILYYLHFPLEKLAKLGN